MYKKIKNKVEKISVKGKIKLVINCLILALTIVSTVGTLAMVLLKANIKSYNSVELVNSAITDCRINLNYIARILREAVLEEGNIISTDTLQELKKYNATSQECASVSEEMSIQANNLENMLRAFRVLEIK